MNYQVKVHLDQNTNPVVVTGETPAAVMETIKAMVDNGFIVAVAEYELPYDRFSEGVETVVDWLVEVCKAAQSYAVVTGEQTAAVTFDNIVDVFRPFVKFQDLDHN